MKPVTRQPEPPNFNTRVRTPGQRFLTRTPNPTSHEFKYHRYWSRAHNELYTLYSGVCAYCSAWIPMPRNPQASDDHSSVDHFIPKSHNPHQAYEWDNFRLARAFVNQDKGDSVNIDDPFEIPHGLFTLDFRTFLINASTDFQRHSATINLLNKSRLVEERTRWVSFYVRSFISFSELQKRLPFVADEMIRQEFDSTFLPRIRAITDRFKKT